MTAALTFLVLLPFATGLLGALLGLLDRADNAAVLRRIAWRGLPFLAAGMLFGTRAAAPALAAVATALGLHVAVTGAVRWMMGRGWLNRAYRPWWDNER